MSSSICKHRRIILIALSLVCSMHIGAQRYTSQLLSDMAGKIGYTLPDSMCTSGYHDAGTYNGKALTVGVDANGVVNHIGYKLFATDMKIMFQSDVFDFLERYFLELSLIKDIYMVDRKMRDDKVELLTGTLQTVLRINQEVPFNINQSGDSYYTVNWNVDGREILCVQFPIQYELLLGTPKIELEKQMRNLISAATIKTDNLPVPPETEVMSDGVLRSVPNDYYQVESVTNASYYNAPTEGEILRPVFSAEHKDYSVANMFLTNVAADKNYRIYVEQNLYGGAKQTYTITLKEWLTYCKANKLTTYFAVEEEREDGIKALLIARSPSLGYNHLLSVIIPDNFIEKSDAMLKVKLNAFIPTQNVKSLYGQYKQKPRKRI